MAFALGAGGNVRIQRLSWRGRGRAWLRSFWGPVGFSLLVGATPIAASAAHLDAASGGPIYEAIVIDAETGHHLWAERFDKPLADFFDMQDEIVTRLANALNAQFVVAEARRADTISISE